MTVKKPTGLTIDRDDSDFILKWKTKKDSCDFLELQYHFFTNKDTFKSAKNFINQGFKVTGFTWSSTKSFSSSKKEYKVTMPTKAIGFIFRIRGGKSLVGRGEEPFSDWVYKTFNILKPKDPKVTATWGGSGSPNKTTFTYEAKDKKHRPFKKVEYRTKWVTNFNGKPNSYKWTGTPTSSTSKTGTIFNSTETVSTGSHTRIVQCRAIGNAGSSEWESKWHTYAAPNAPVITKATAKQYPAKGTTTLNLEWNLKKGSAHPVDKTTVQYLIHAPGANMSVPIGESFTDADTPVSKSASKWSEEISTLLSDDDVLFARIKVTHDTRDNFSNAVIALKGRLAEPTGVSTTPNQGTHTIVVNATNASSVPDAYLACVYKRGDVESILGIIPHGSSSVSMVVPPWTGSAGSVGVYAVVGSYTAQPADADGVIVYTISKPQMTSPKVWKGTLAAPTISVVQAEIEETATVTWDWVDSSATGAEVSWANHSDAWESTDEPDTYIVDVSRASRLNVNGLEPGIIWYFRVRLITQGDETSYGLYSDTAEINLASAPAVPVLEMSDQVIDPEGEAIASWVYVSGDNTPQAHATIATYSGGVYTPILQADEDQSIVINPAELEWSIGDYLLAVQVESESGRFSEWSDTVPVSVREPLTCSITQTSLTSKTITVGGDSVTYPYALTEMPMTVTVEGADETGQTMLVIKRADDYVIETPDEKQMNGYEDEVVCQYVYTGEAQQTINIEDVQGKLNDTATYYIEATVTDDLGRVATDRYPNDDPDDFFTVLWDDQALIPKASAGIVDDDHALLTIEKPVGAQAGDVIDIYRMTADRPQLIAQDIEMDDDPVFYVDPYPALGANGYRFVYKTKNGDTTTTDEELAWLDTDTLMPADHALLDFNGQRISLGYNVKFSNTWGKEFQETRYLGGAIQGDWTAGVSRTGSIDSVTVPVRDEGAFRALRRLAEYEGICHIRTCDGSVITANVDLGDDFGYDTAGKIQNVKLSFTRVDPIELDGMTLADWEGES